MQRGSNLLLGKLTEKKVGGNVGMIGSDDGVSRKGNDTSEVKPVEDEKSSEDVGRGEVFVSQVAAAIAALHERSLFEERIRALRFSPPLSKSQLYALLPSHFLVTVCINASCL